jgi:hypothetical protein
MHGQGQLKCNMFRLLETPFKVEEEKNLFTRVDQLKDRDSNI